MGELGNTLSRARRARGISIEDAERDTHVSRRYLQALETEDFQAFPAPVYARGFLRTYSRYLGLNPDELLRVFPNGDLTVDITPLPTVTRPPAQLINVNWVVAGVVALFLLGAGLLLLNGGEDPAVVDQRAQQAAAQGQTTSPTTQVQAPSPTNGDTPVQGKAITPIQAGRFPDFVGADLVSAYAVLRDNQLNFVVIEYANRTVPKGIIISQSPGAGGKADTNTAITLHVSTGAPQ